MLIYSEFFLYYITLYSQRINTLSPKRTNEYVLCAAILHELGKQQWHTRPKVECGVAVLPTSGV